MGNATTISGSAIPTAVATEPDLCRVSGLLRDVHGNVLKGVGITVRHLYTPIGQVSSTLVLNERRTYRTDGDGYVQFDLIRNSQVDVELPNRLFDHVLHVTVPDAASVDLISLLYPYVVSVEFVTASPVSLGIGDTLTFELTATLSNGVEVVLDGASVTLESSDEAVLQKSSSLVFEALTGGSVSVSLAEFDSVALALLLQPDGTSVSLQSVPTPTLPSAVVVNVS